MAEYGYGYRTQFDEPTPLAYKEPSIPQFTKPGAKPARARADVANLLSKLPMKDSGISFGVELMTNTGSDINKAIDPITQVPGANPQETLPDNKLYALSFPVGALPKIQSFTAALHSNKKDVLVVGGRIAGLHPFGGEGFQQTKQSYALFVVDMEQYATAAAALPSQYFESVGLMNTQATQVKTKDGKNYLYIAGGYGYDSTVNDMKTFDTLTVLDVDGMVDNIWAAAKATKPTVPDLGNFIWQTHHEDIQVTGGKMMFNPASNEPSKQDHLYLVVGQAFKGSYGSESPDTYTYIRGMRKFAVPYPTGQGGTLPPIVVTEINASKDTTNAPDPDAISCQLARRDLNVVPTFLPGTFKDGKAYPGATILSGVFNQDGSNSPYLQPLVVNFNPENKTISDPTPQNISMYTSNTFFQLFNNYHCCNVQLFSAGQDNQGYIYNVLVGGVSLFYKTKNDSTGSGLDQVNSLFKAPFTTDISIVKQDNHGNFTQRLVPPTATTADFLKNNQLSTFGTESFFIPNPAIPMTSALPESSGVLDLDWIISKGQKQFKLGTMFGGIENLQNAKPPTYPPPYPPSFSPESTDATSRMVDVYITFDTSSKH